ncbi:PaaI family thioesterase [Noviherbaspirillum galbum]|uniref:Medium/long-chain acyl-CoA thioesterase YigI n=1 Tax=Noviherbaspirillum galbum TaxID=2709383 RepID=A0A6B3SR61_9BURK|nr:PaaI family thioesterase [Noviherbaspirillum galbum]NEX63257.1 PaaI family thioesterase [Noviherbaspirillum galbum]
MTPPDPDYRQVVERSFQEAAFLSDLGIRLHDVGPGWCETVLPVARRHLQHTGIIHAGVQSTIADHTAGAAAMSLTPAHEYILTVEFKIHLLRPGKGESLFCRAEVLKPGRHFHVVESQVYALDDGKRTLVSKLVATMAVLARPSAEA